MRKIAIICIVIFSLISVRMSAQQGGRGDDFEKKYHTQKVAYLTTEMDLSPEESAMFWPLYNAHSKEEKNLKNEIKEHRRIINKKGDALTEEEALEALNNYQYKMGKMHQLQVDYQLKYLEVIPAKKVVVMLRAEKEFRRELLRKLGDQRRHRGGKYSNDQE